MAEIVNLHKARKRAARAREAAGAAANRVKYGRPKPERELEAARAEQRRRLLDAHKTEPGDTS